MGEKHDSNFGLSLHFEDWLVSQRKAKRTVKSNVQYAKRFHSVLETGDASPLLGLSPPNRHQAMEGLTALSKYQGLYDSWQQIIKKYDLKWTSQDSIATMQRFFNPSLTLDDMIAKVRAMMKVLPPTMGEVVRFACLTGLRPSEACESVRLLNNFPPVDKSVTGNQQYYNPETQILQHYHYPDIFLRATKKAYLSYLSVDNYQQIASLGSKTPTWNAISLACRRRNIDMEMRFCRKIFASHLRQKGIQSEFVNLLQGRVDSDILTRHYLVPSSSLKDQVLDAVKELQRMID